MRIKVSADGNADHPDVFFLPGDMTGYGIYADVQDLGIQGRELLPPRTEFGDLGGSSGRPVQGMERNHDIVLPQIIAQAHRMCALARYRRQFEVRCLVANL